MKQVYKDKILLELSLVDEPQRPLSRQQMRSGFLFL